MKGPYESQRARFLRTAGRLALGLAVAPQFAAARSAPATGAATVPRTMNTRVIPSTREALPVVGCGTWIGFDVPDAGADAAGATARLAAVLDALFDAGGTVLDSSPMYGRSEAVTGALLAARRADAPDPPAPARRPFVATKVWTQGRAAGIEQMENSLRLLGRVDLMQVHNLVDWKTHLPTMREWKAQGRIRYVGVTHYTSSAYAELEAVMRAQTLDFVQVDYAFDDRAAAERILPLAADRGMAVLVNRPLGGGGLVKRLSAQALPPWAEEIGATTWSQILLKFVLSHPAVTCAIPGTGNPLHMAENAAAGSGTIPDQGFWARHGGIA